MEFGDPSVSVHAPAHQESKIAERVAVYNAGDKDKVARTGGREDERRKWKAHHRNVRKYCAGVSKESSSKGDSPS